MATTLKYIKADKAPLKNASRTKNLTYLLWGDPVHVKDSNAPDSEWVEVMARNWDSGFVKRTDIMDDPIMEIYVIDVGQGDGVLFKTPDNKWHVVDAGTTNSRQMTGKGAANFIRFKFIDDLRMDKVEIENMVLTHPDLDHFGGMIDLLKGELNGHDPFDVEVKNFYHNGLGKFVDHPKLGEREDGEVDDYPIDKYNLSKKRSFIKQLLDGKADFEHHMDEFSKEFKEFSGLLVDTADHISRLSAEDEFLPGYDDLHPEVQIKVLGPIVETYDGTKKGLRYMTSNSVTVNGHSIVLRVDYKDVRILLTGDLNESSQKLLLNYIPEEEYEVDIAKGCHHGSEDILFDFLGAMKPRATVISSGDNESYAHPKPLVMGASAYFGRTFKEDPGDRKEFPPLLYSTELARSITLEFPQYVHIRDGWDDDTYDRHSSNHALIEVFGENRKRRMRHSHVATDLVYGLVTIRTDGHRAIIATRKEAGNNFDVKRMTFE